MYLDENAFSRLLIQSYITKKSCFCIIEFKKPVEEYLYIRCTRIHPHHHPRKLLKLFKSPFLFIYLFLESHILVGCSLGCTYFILTCDTAIYAIISDCLYRRYLWRIVKGGDINSQFLFFFLVARSFKFLIIK